MQISASQKFPCQFPCRGRRIPLPVGVGKQDNVLIYHAFPMPAGRFLSRKKSSLMAAEIQAMCSRRALMRLVPVRAASGLDDERHRELAMRLARGFHHRLDHPGGIVGLGLRYLEQQLVVDL
jgi:hypothetical protein